MVSPLWSASEMVPARTPPFPRGGGNGGGSPHSTDDNSTDHDALPRIYAPDLGLKVWEGREWLDLGTR